MAYEKKETLKQSEHPVQDFQAKIQELEAKLKEVEASKLKLEEEAVEKVCAALGTSPAKLAIEEKRKAEAEKMMEYNIGKIIVAINGKEYTGRGVEKAGIVECIMSLAGNKRMREIRARIGNNYEIHMLSGGAMTSRVVGQSEDSII